MTIDLNFIVGIIGILSTLSMLVVGLIKLPAERAKMEAERKKLSSDSAKGFAEAAKISEEAAALSAKRALVATTEFEEYRIQVKKEMDELHCEINKLKDADRAKDIVIEDLLLKLDDVQDWAERLVHQVKSLGGEPVKIRQRKGNETNAKEKGNPGK